MKLRTVVEIVVVLLLAALVVDKGWNLTHKAAPAPSAQFNPAAAIPAAAKVAEKTIAPPPKLVVKEKASVAKALKLPDEIAKDPDKQITATAQVVHEDKSKTDAVAVMDVTTGKTEIETKEEARPWFSFINEKELGGRVGFTLRGIQSVAYGRWSFVRTGNIYYGIYAEAASPPMAGTPVLNQGNVMQGDGKFMLDVSYRW